MKDIKLSRHKRVSIWRASVIKMGIVYELQVTADEDPGAQVEKTDFLLSWAQSPILRWKKGLVPAILSTFRQSRMNTQASFGQSCSLHNIQILSPIISFSSEHLSESILSHLFKKEFRSIYSCLLCVIILDTCLLIIYVLHKKVNSLGKEFSVLFKALSWK